MRVPARGGIYRYQGIRRGYFLVVSIDALNRAGTTIVLEVTDQAPDIDLRALLAVQLTDADPTPGSWVLCWRVNYLAASRLELDHTLGQVSAETMERVVRALHAVTEP